MYVVYMQVNLYRWGYKMLALHTTSWFIPKIDASYSVGDWQHQHSIQNHPHRRIAFFPQSLLIQSLKIVIPCRGLIVPWLVIPLIQSLLVFIPWLTIQSIQVLGFIPWFTIQIIPFAIMPIEVKVKLPHRTGRICPLPVRRGINILRQISLAVGRTAKIQELRL